MEIKPMLLQEFEGTIADALQRYPNWIYQEKQNGTRAVVHVQNGRITSIRNRRNIPVLNLFPELKALKLSEHNAIIDAELVVFDGTGKSCFYGGINQRDKKLYDYRVATMPVHIMAFDLIYFDGEVVAGKPYKERMALLREKFQSEGLFKVVDDIPNPLQYWNERIVPDNREGLVIKNPSGRYAFDTRSADALKLKNYKTAFVTVEQIAENPKGIKIIGKATIENESIISECQLSSAGNVKVGDVVPVVYLDIVNGRMVQPHKIKGWKVLDD